MLNGPTEIPIVRRYTTITTAVRTPVPTILWIFSLFILNFPPCYHSPISGDTIQYDSIIAYSAEKIYCDCDKNSPRNPPPEKHIAQKRNAIRSLFQFTLNCKKSKADQTEVLCFLKYIREADSIIPNSAFRIHNLFFSFSRLFVFRRTKATPHKVHKLEIKHD